MARPWWSAKVRPRGWVGSPGGGGGGGGGGVDGAAVVVGEGEAEGVVGVAGDAQEPGVVEAVVERAQGDQVRGLRETVVFAVDEVVDVQPAGLPAAGDAAAAV